MLQKQTDGMKGNAFQRFWSKPITSCCMGIFMRLLLFYVYTEIEKIPAFKRKIQPEEMWHYKYPPTDDYVPASILMPASFVVPFTIFCFHFLVSHDRFDFLQANYALSMAWVLNAVLTSLIKVSVGRPRPDFYYRCFPDGIGNLTMDCKGNAAVINEGRKSFPSGHSSMAFTGFGFLFLYLAAKLQIFAEKGRGDLFKFCIALSPLLLALMVAISRTCDYHHHWQDVTVGSMLGMTIAYVSYRQCYPSLTSLNCTRPYSSHIVISDGCFAQQSSSDENEEKPLIEEEKISKWI